MTIYDDMSGKVLEENRVKAARAEELEERIAMQEKLMIKLRADLANARSSYKVNVEERVIPFTQTESIPIRTKAAPSPQVEAPAPRILGGKGGCGPAWTRGEIEPPADEKNMGTYTTAVREEVKMFGGKAGCAPTWLTSGLEAPKGEEFRGTASFSYFTKE